MRSKIGRNSLRRSPLSLSLGGGTVEGGGDGAATEGLERWLAGSKSSSAETPMIAGIGFYQPPSGSTSKLEVVGNSGNATVVGRIELWDMTNNVMIVRNSFSSTTAARNLNSLTTGTPALGVISTALVRYEVRIYVVANTGPTDFVELWKAAFVNGAPA